MSIINSEKKKNKNPEQTGEIPKYVKPTEARLRKKVYIKNNQKSRTIPNQTMTINEMVARYRRGLPIHGSSRVPLYGGGDEPLMDLDQMDLIDRQEYVDSVADKLVDVRQRMKDAADTEEKAAALEKFDKAVKDAISKMYNDQKDSSNEKPPK